MSPKRTKKAAMPEAGRVLIADDSMVARKVLASQLETLGFHVVAAASTGEEAVVLYEKFKPDFVIMDVKMPGMDGIEASKIITNHIPVPIILITGYSSEALIDRAIESGVFAYIIKPVTKKDILPAIKLAFARFNEFKVLKTEVLYLQEAIETRKFIERAKGILMKRLGISEDDAFKVLQSQSQKENKKLKDIAEAVITASRVI